MPRLYISRKSLLRAGFACLGAACLPLSLSADEAKTNNPDIVIGTDISLVRTGHLAMNRRGEEQPLAVPVIITVLNRSGQPASTSASITGKDAAHAKVELEKAEDTAQGQMLHLRVLGLKPTFEETETLLTIETKQGEVVKAKTSIPVRVSVPTMLKLGNGTLFEGDPQPGLVNRALNMRTIPKAAVSYPEAKLANLCLHDLAMTVLDQYGDPLGPLYDGALVWAALGESDYETTNRTLKKDGTFLDTIGLWQFVGEVKDMSVDPGRAEVQKFASSPPPPCAKQQYATYEPMLIQYQVGGYPIGAYMRTITLIDSGNDHKPRMKIEFAPGLDPHHQPEHKEPGR